MAKVSGAAPDLSIRVVTVPVWLQLVVMLVMLHTSIRKLHDPLCTRAFKKQSAVVELQLLASLFIAMKVDGALTWSWVAVFWPLWVPVAMLLVLSVILTLMLPCTLLIIACNYEVF